MLAFLRDRRQRRSAQSSAETAYWAAEDAARDACAELADTVDPHRRAKLLRSLSESTIRMAREFHAAFGVDICDDGRPMPTVLGYEAHLYLLLHHVEYAISISRGRFADGSSLDHAAAVVFDEMVVTPDLVDRMRLLEQLYEAVLPHVGGQAAETVACLPAPGMRGWEEL
jgi:hypothetical protein